MLDIITCHPQDPKLHRMPRWQRSVLHDPDTGEIYAPAAASDNETAALMSAAFEGVDLAELDGHVFLPLSFMEREYPEHADLWLLMRCNVRRVNEGEGASS